MVPVGYGFSQFEAGAMPQVPQKYWDEAKKFGDAVRLSFGTALANISVSTPCSQPIELQLPQMTAVDAVVLREDMRQQGQRIAGYSVSWWDGDKWKSVGSGHGTNVHGATIGYRVIDTFAPIKTTKLQFQCTAAVADPINIRQFSAHKMQPP